MLLYADGFDGQDLSQRYPGHHAFFVNIPAVDTAFGLGYAAGFIGNPGGIQAFRRDVIPSTKVIVGYRFRAEALIASNHLAINNNGGTTSQFGLRVDPAGSVTVFRGGAIMATSDPNLVPPASWNYIEVSLTCQDSGGRCIVRLNGNPTPIIDFTGDTRNSGSLDTLDSIVFSNASSGYFKWDDLYIANDQGGVNDVKNFLGDIRVLNLTPNAPGSATQLAVTGAAADWDAVNERPPSNADYVSGGSAGLKDLYALTDLPAGVTAVHGIQTGAIVKKTDSGTRNVRTRIKSGATEVFGSDYAPGTSDLYFFTPRDVDPNGSVPWTVSAINALEAGVEVL